MRELPHDAESILALFTDGPARLAEAIAGLDDAEFDTAPEAGSWAIRQIVHHIADGDDLWTTGIKMALGDSEAVFGIPWYWEVPQTTWAERWAYARRAVESSVALLVANRRHVAQLVQAIPDAWQKPLRVRWPEGQEEQGTVGGVIKMQTGHLLDHLEDILEIRRTHGF